MTSGPQTQSSKAATGSLSCNRMMTWCDSGGRRFIFQEEIPVPPTPSYQQSREPAAAKQSLRRDASPNTAAESPKTRCSSSKAGAPWGSGCSSKTSAPKCPDSMAAKTPPHPQESTWDHPGKSPPACSSRKRGRSPSPTTESTENK